MAFVVTHRSGAMDETEDLSVIDELLDELDIDDPEHPDVAVSRGDWSLSIFGNGTVIWGNVEDGEDERHLAGLSREEIARLARAVATDDLEAVEARPWLPGYPESG